MKTEHTILGFSFYINWDAKGKIGIDQHGHLWVNQNSPEPETPELLNVILDTYNQLKELGRKDIVLNKYSTLTT